MPRCYLALGGNSGPVETTFRRALGDLADHPGVQVGRVSTLHRFAAVGDRAGGEFINAAAELLTELSPVELLDLTQSVETAHGRCRDVHWGPRTVDLDLILYGQQIIAEPRILVPHPAAWYRRFVLDPLAEIAADVLHPVRQLTIASLRNRLLPRPLPIALVGADTQTRVSLAAGLCHRFPLIAVRHCGTDEAARLWLREDSTPEPALVIWLDGALSPTSNRRAFASLPIASRIDAATLTGPLETALQHVIESALG